MKKFEQIKKTINDVEYTAQFNGLAAALKAMDECYIDGTSNISTFKLSKYILENVIIDPKVDIDDFENADVLNEVTVFGRDVMQGTFRQEENEGGTKEKGKR